MPVAPAAGPRRPGGRCWRPRAWGRGAARPPAPAAAARRPPAPARAARRTPAAAQAAAAPSSRPGRRPSRQLVADRHGSGRVSACMRAPIVISDDVASLLQCARRACPGPGGPDQRLRALGRRRGGCQGSRRRLRVWAYHAAGRRAVGRGAPARRRGRGADLVGEGRPRRRRRRYGAAPGTDASAACQAPRCCCCGDCGGGGRDKPCGGAVAGPRRLVEARRPRAARRTTRGRPPGF